MTTDGDCDGDSGGRRPLTERDTQRGRERERGREEERTSVGFGLEGVGTGSEGGDPRSGSEVHYLPTYLPHPTDRPTDRTVTVCGGAGWLAGWLTAGEGERVIVWLCVRDCV